MIPSNMLQLNRELRKLHTWLIVNRLSLNIAKTKFLIFHPYSKSIKQRITLKIHKKAIPESEYIKHLGIMVDSTRSWNIHIDKISKTISTATGLLCKIRAFVNMYCFMFSFCLLSCCLDYDVTF